MDILFHHGWGLDASYWDSWKRCIPESIATYCFDRGYFSTNSKDIENISKWKNSNNKILICHSFGLHMVPIEHIIEANQVVALSSFDTFGSLPILESMQKDLESDPEALIKRFYKQVFHPQKILPEIPKTINSELLLQDLELMKTSTLSQDAFTGQVLLVHGKEDRIVPYSKIGVLKRFLPQADLLTFNKSGHSFGEKAIIDILETIGVRC